MSAPDLPPNLFLGRFSNLFPEISGFHVAPRKSRWQFKTSSGLDMTVGVVAASEGMFVLTDSYSDDEAWKFSYTALGAGAGLAIPIGKLAKIISELLPFTYSPSELPSIGDVFALPVCKGRELELNDFVGGAVVIQGGGGLAIAGGGVSLFFTGIPPGLLQLPPEIALPTALASARALIFARGFSIGLGSAGISGAGVAGVVSLAGPYVEDPS